MDFLATKYHPAGLHPPVNNGSGCNLLPVVPHGGYHLDHRDQTNADNTAAKSHIRSMDFSDGSSGKSPVSAMPQKGTPGQV
jgi:hypothetical protein